MRTILKITDKGGNSPVYATTMTIFENSIICLFGGVVVFNGAVSDLISIELTVVEHVDFNWVNNINAHIKPYNAPEDEH